MSKPHELNRGAPVVTTAGPLEIIGTRRAVPAGTRGRYLRMAVRGTYLLEVPGGQVYVERNMFRIVPERLRRAAHR